MTKKVDSETRKEVVIPSTCRICYSDCPILVRTLNGVVRKIEVNPEVEGYNGICGKGVAGLMVLYDPNRLEVPLRRTNPEKGSGVDPKWKEITWDEALEEIVEKFKKIRDDNPMKLLGIWTTTMGKYMTFCCIPFFCGVWDQEYVDRRWWGSLR